MALALINLIKSNHKRSLPLQLIRDYCKNVIDFDTPDENGKTAFWYAYENNDYDSMWILIEEGSRNLNIRPRGKQSDGSNYTDRIVRWYELVNGTASDCKTFYNKKPTYRHLSICAGVDVDSLLHMEMTGKYHTYIETYRF